MKKKMKVIIMIFLGLVIVTGCNKNEVKGDQDYLTLLQMTNPTPTDTTSGRESCKSRRNKKRCRKEEIIFMM